MYTGLGSGDKYTMGQVRFQPLPLLPLIEMQWNQAGISDFLNKGLKHNLRVTIFQRGHFHVTATKSMKWDVRMEFFSTLLSIISP